ncbi:MAG: hypothetical protein SFV23_20345 [Planctomycetaceae bacterium]|nr:hypothetical protein [Planctomycetaceae bacterium]
MRQAHARCQQAGQSRRGLSLLEMLLAIGLGLLLVSGIYAAITQSARQTAIGRIEMERLQIARAVFRKMELDLRAAMFAAETATSDSAGSVQEATSTSTSGESSSSGGGTAGNAESATTTTIESEQEDEWTGSLGIRGSASELWIDLSYIRRQIDFSMTATAGSDLQTVAYFLSTANSSQGDSSGQAAVGEGLVRSRGDRSVLRTLNASSGDSILPGPMELLAPEIEQVGFRFFDGLTWYEEWDSSTIGALPRAVEISIGFRAPFDDKGYLGNAVVNAATKSFRMVVAIPASDPLAAEEEL